MMQVQIQDIVSFTPVLLGLRTGMADLPADSVA